MNKLKLYITSVVGIVGVSLIALLASGCGDDDPDSTHELVGTWDLEQIIISFTIGGQTIIDTLPPDSISGTLTFEEDETFDLAMDMQGQVINTDGTWSTDGDSLTLDPSDTSETMTFQYDVSGTTLTITGVIQIQGVPVPVTTIQTWKKQKLIGCRRLGI